MRMIQSKKGQMGSVAFAIFFCVCMGFILWQFTPSLDAVRIDRLTQTDNSHVLEKIWLYLLIPMLWFFWLLCSAFLIIGSTRTS